MLGPGEMGVAAPSVADTAVVGACISANTSSHRKSILQHSPPCSGSRAFFPLAAGAAVVHWREKKARKVEKFKAVRLLTLLLLPLNDAAIGDEVALARLRTTNNGQTYNNNKKQQVKQAVEVQHMYVKDETQSVVRVSRLTGRIWSEVSLPGGGCRVCVVL